MINWDIHIIPFTHKLIKKICNSILVLIICVGFPCYAGDEILWIKNVKHVINTSGVRQIDWASDSAHNSFVNGTFFHSNFTPIIPYSSHGFIYSDYRSSKWWYIERINNQYFLNSPSISANILSDFTLAGCPPLILDNNIVSLKTIYKLCSKKFIKKLCRRTLFGITDSGAVFIIITSGNLIQLPKKIKNLIPNVKWLINLDGGSSTFLTLNKKIIVKNKRKIPSIITFDLIK